MIIEGTLYWAKLDKPRDNYNKQRKIMKDGEPDRWGREYAVTIANLTKETKLQLRDAGLLDKVKNKMDDLEDNITFRLDEFDKDGEPQSIKVVNSDGKEWDWKEDGLIANESRGAIKFNVWRPSQGKPRLYPVSLMVLEHILYEAPEGSGEREDPDDWGDYAKKPAKAAAKPEKATKKRVVTEEDDLDDDVPF